MVWLKAARLYPNTPVTVMLTNVSIAAAFSSGVSGGTPQIRRAVSTSKQTNRLLQASGRSGNAQIIPR